MPKSLVAGGALLALIATACNASDNLDDAAAAPPSYELDGVWTIQNIKLESGELAGSHTFDVQPSMLIFREPHYSIVAVTGFASRAYLGNEPSNEDLARAYSAFIGHTGTYEQNDSGLTLSPLVAKYPSQMMDGASVNYGLDWTEDGDLLLQSNSAQNGQETMRLIRVVEEDLELNPTEQRLQGVWRRVERTFGTGEEAEVHRDDIQPGYYIFEGDKFSANFVGEFEPRTPLGEAPTPDEYAAVVEEYRSYAGTFSVFEEELKLWPNVAINPNNMRGQPFRPLQLEWEGEDVWMIYPANGVETRTKITKVAD